MDRDHLNPPEGRETRPTEDRTNHWLERVRAGELEQPMVFFRDGWEFRWLSGHQVLARLELAEPSRSIVDERGSFEDPPELTHFLGILGGTLRGQAPELAAPVRATAEEVQGTFGRRRGSIVHPGTGAVGEDFMLQLGLECGAAFVLAPGPSTFVWTVVSSRPTIVVAGDDLLLELAEDLRGRPGWRRRRLMSATRFVFAFGSAQELEHDALDALRPLLGRKTEIRRIVPE